MRNSLKNINSESEFTFWCLKILINLLFWSGICCYDHIYLFFGAFRPINTFWIWNITFHYKNLIFHSKKYKTFHYAVLLFNYDICFRRTLLILVEFWRKKKVNWDWNHICSSAKHLTVAWNSEAKKLLNSKNSIFFCYKKYFHKKLIKLVWSKSNLCHEQKKRSQKKNVGIWFFFFRFIVHEIISNCVSI